MSGMGQSSSSQSNLQQQQLHSSHPAGSVAKTTTVIPMSLSKSLTIQSTQCAAAGSDQSAAPQSDTLLTPTTEAGI